MSAVPGRAQGDQNESAEAATSILESLRASEARYRELFENANDLVFTVDLDGRFRSVNQTVEETTGFTRAELIGSDLSILVPPEYVDIVRGMMRHKVSTRERTRYEIEIVAKDGSRIPLEIGSWLILERGEPVAIHGIARDISERKEAEKALQATVAELERSNQELSQFAGVASHDMHAPLRRISTLGQWLHEQKSDQLDEEGREWISHIVFSAGQMQQLIDSLLAHSRVGAASTPTDRVQCDDAVECAISNLALTINENGAEIRVGPLPEVEANRVELVQLFQNLIDNALKYRRDVHPLIEIAAEDREEHWLFRIRDNGIGIMVEHREKVFDAFQRLHGDDQYQGAGIGLATCKKIVERLGGSIWIESPPTAGSMFLFTLPK